MVWSDRLFESSFRGVPFLIKGTKTSGGRRGSDHEFTNREQPYADDTGRKQRKFSITAFLVGGGEQVDQFVGSPFERRITTEHYFEQRDALIAAIETRGPGTLIHPYFGVLEVVCRSYTVVEDAMKGRGCTIELSFTEAGDITGLTDAPLVAENITVIADQLNQDVKNAFTEGLNASAKVAGEAGAITEAGRASLIDTIQSGAEFAENIIKKIEAGVQIVDDVKNGITSTIQKYNTIIAQSAFAIRQIGDLASDLIRLPGELVTQFQDNISLIKEAGVDTVSAYKKLFSGKGFGSDLDTTNTTIPSRVQESKNNRLTRMMFNSMYITTASQFAVQIDFESQSEAFKTRDDLLEAIDELIDEVSDDLANPLQDDLGIQTAQSVFTSDMYDSLQDLRTQIANSIPGDPADTVIVESTVKEFECGLATAYALTGSADSYDDLIVRNDLDNPALLDPELIVKVVSNE